MNDKKQEYYDYFMSIKSFINVSAVCRSLGIIPQQFNQFLVKHDLQKMSITDLERVKSFLNEVIIG